eukprot:TRINITY_DN3342_c0_g1_i1.p1 TRINITY_DN3342_c0_g1~~TRINITY_DN3342_c0_g1_i1.p1  ORF type:complete len:861 (-),score=129.26 TRINITY_DN3342_c0_g1_i1:250-2565(-)
MPRRSNFSLESLKDYEGDLYNKIIQLRSERKKYKASIKELLQTNDVSIELKNQSKSLLNNVNLEERENQVLRMRDKESSGRLSRKEDMITRRDDIRGSSDSFFTRTKKKNKKKQLPPQSPHPKKDGSIRRTSLRRRLSITDLLGEGKDKITGHKKEKERKKRKIKEEERCVVYKSSGSLFVLEPDRPEPIIAQRIFQLKDSPEIKPRGRRSATTPPPVLFKKNPEPLSPMKTDDNIPRTDSNEKHPLRKSTPHIPHLSTYSFDTNKRSSFPEGIELHYEKENQDKKYNRKTSLGLYYDLEILKHLRSLSPRNRESTDTSSWFTDSELLESPRFKRAYSWDGCMGVVEKTISHEKMFISVKRRRCNSLTLSFEHSCSPGEDSEKWNFVGREWFTNKEQMEESAAEIPRLLKIDSKGWNIFSGAYGWATPRKLHDTQDDDYNKYFLGKKHTNWVGHHKVLGHTAISVIKEDSNYRALIRTSEETKTVVVPISSVKSKNILRPKPSSTQLLAKIEPLLTPRGVKRFTKVNNEKLEAKLSTFKKLSLAEMIQSTVDFKVGVVYCESDQTEEEIFSKTKYSPQFDQFLSILGKRVQLQGFGGYNGGLDTSDRLSNGKESIYSTWEDTDHQITCNIMFHVSVFIPCKEGSSEKCLMRKTHVGNDVCLVVFKEGKGLYDPNIIQSKFNQVVIVVSPWEMEGDTVTKYRVEVASKEGIPTFEPKLPEPPLFDPIPLQEFLLQKLVCGERATMNSSMFRTRVQKSREYFIRQLADQLTQG